MNCVNCGGRIISEGCTCTSADLLKKLERSNDDWINEREENASLKRRLKPIYDVWGRWKDFARIEYPTVEHIHQALYDFEKAIQKSMIGYNAKHEGRRPRTCP